MAEVLETDTADRDLTSQVQVVSYENTTDYELVIQGMVYLGDGSKDLDGSGGWFEFTIEIDDQTMQPNPQKIWFGSEVQSVTFTEQFPLALNATVKLKVKSPNAADTDVGVEACIYEVGVKSIIEYIMSTEHNVYNEVYDTNDRPKRGWGVRPRRR